MATLARKTAARAPARQGLALYVHIPFCETKCPYCDFNTYAGIEALMPSYVSALANEVAGWGKALERPAAAVGVLRRGHALLPADARPDAPDAPPCAPRST